MAPIRYLLVLATLLRISYGGTLPGRIIGGTEAADGAYPYQVSLQVNGRRHFCSGAILNKDYILTSGHCFIGYNAEDVTILAGTNSLSTGGTTYEAKRLVLHENYDPILEFDNIGLIQVITPIQFNAKVQPIALPKNNTEAGAHLIVTGWGRLSTDGSIPDKLQELVRVDLGLDRCKETLPFFSARQMCTEAKQGEGICFEDYGDPLVENDEVVGIAASTTSLKCGDGSPDIFTRVYKYLRWIADNMA